MPGPHGTQFRLSQAHIDAFQAEGAVVLRQLLQPREVELLRSGIDENLAHPSPRALGASARDAPGWFIGGFASWEENRHYLQLIFGSALAEIAAGLMRSAAVRLYHDHMLT